MLPAGSAPPSLAATMIARESFEKSLPRFASAAPFLCLIDDHLLCPDTQPLLDSLEKQLVDARIFRELWMECCDEETALAREDGPAVVLCEHLDLGTGLAYPRGADEHSAERSLLAPQIEVGLEARNLPAVGVQVASFEADHDLRGEE